MRSFVRRLVHLAVIPAAFAEDGVGVVAVASPAQAAAPTVQAQMQSDILIGTHLNECSIKSETPAQRRRH